MNTFNIYKDGKLIHTCISEDDILTAMHKLQPFSMTHAIEHEGYEIKKGDE